VPPTKFDGVFLPHAEQFARVDLITRHPTGDSLLAWWYVALTGVAGRHQQRQHKPSRRADDRRTEHRPRASQIERTRRRSRAQLLVAGVDDYVHGIGSEDQALEAIRAAGPITAGSPGRSSRRATRLLLVPMSAVA
jgi:hypothetical protein